MNNSNIPPYPSATRTNTFPLRVIAGLLFVILSCNIGKTQATTNQSQIQTQTALQVQQTMQAKDSSQAQQPTQTAQIIQDTPPVQPTIEPTTQPTIELVQPTIEPTTSSEPASSEAQLTLTKSDGQVVNLPFITCTGTNSGEDLNISANTTPGDPPRQVWSVAVSGKQQGPGQYNNLEVAVFYSNPSWLLAGADSAAQVLLENKGSGSFTDVKIVNVAWEGGGEGYVPGSEYKFSAAWTCP